MESWDALLQTLRAYRQAELIFAAVDLDVFSHLHAGPLDSYVLAGKCNADPRGLRRLLDALAATGIVDKKGDEYANGEVAAAYLDAKAPASKLNAVTLMKQSRDRWHELADVVRKGGPDEQAAGAFRRDADVNRTFINAMHDIGFNNGKAIAKGMDLSEYRRLLDAGGGPASYSIALLERYPEMRATLADLPLTLDVARANVERYGMSGRIRMVGADLYAGSSFDFGGSFDLMLISNVIHMASAEDNAALFVRLAPHLEPGGMLIVHDAFISEDRTSPEETALFAIDMLLATEHGDCYSYAQVGEWMQAAGLADVRPVEGVFERPSLLTGIRPAAAV